ncbi:hypothetical protein VTN77DRAFT_9799 [Rasamsonia byssochlamydoides]|uniref:uncharacterized protein n=1 Tax=Rasamsonia byssochlamydoides TaxID=89139 RepID=UPI0037448DA1
MVFSFRLAVAALALVETASTSPTTLQSPLRYANHIFNAIHSSMRQWGSSWNHNGMSFFLATVPKDTLLYHGSHDPGPVTGINWLAFEPEHALFFTSSWTPPQSGEGVRQTPQMPLHGDAENKEGWLHTYAAAKDLRLLYVDGLSAAKTGMGTLDTQDRILFNDSITRPHQDAERAELACKLFQEDWIDRIDGLIRMESGFEIILCNFARDLRTLHVVRAKPYDPRDGPLLPGGTKNDLFRLYKVIASRFDGIGGGRVRLNYDHFVTAYDYDVDLFPDEGKLPRLAHLPADSLDPMKRDLRNLVLTHDPFEDSANWQAITDMIVERYARDLKYFVSGKLSSTRELRFEIERALRPFIDFDSRNTTLEIDRCTTQFLPASLPNNTLAARAVTAVSHTICATLLTALWEEDYNTIIERLEGLIDYLSWTVWKECPEKCDWNEVCFIPIWPAGTVEDHDHPQCKDKPSSGGKSYWDRLPGRYQPEYDPFLYPYHEL